VGRKHKKIVRSHNGEIVLVVGKDLQVSQIANMDRKVIVGKFGHRWISTRVLSQFMEHHWALVLAMFQFFIYYQWAGSGFYSR